ncbi:MAG TPA: acyltransferase [Methylorubrum populi]|uniref:Acyltransferase n=1 Tax=Methylorubrum populi TaxID=223967 RepID=A0A921JGF1_9HYPH|nr:acyltransferase [Methylorubrum populi]
MLDRKAREIQLDVIRGVAIVLAMGWHLNGGDMTFAASDVWLSPGRIIGWAGVDLFFVLSGFLVGGLVVREVSATRGFDYRRFLIRRAFRLWPVLYVYLAVQVVLTDRPWTGFVPQVLLHVQNYFETPLHHLWSLAVEEQFYLLIGLSLPFLARLRLGAGHVLAGLVAAILATWLLRPLVALAGVDPISIQIQTQYRLDGLALGVALALLSQRFPEIYARLARPRLAHFAGALAAFAALFWLTDDLSRSCLGYTLAALGSGLAILAVHGSRHRFFASPAARLLAILGLYSYPMYVWHNGIGNRITPRLAELAGITSPDLVVIGKYVLSIGLAIVIGLAIEQPFMRLRDRLFARPGPLPVRPSGPASPDPAHPLAAVRAGDLS